MNIVFKKIEAFFKVMDKIHGGNCYYISQYLEIDATKKIISYLMGYLFHIIDGSIRTNTFHKNFHKVLYAIEYFDFYEKNEDVSNYIIGQLNVLYKKIQNDSDKKNRAYILISKQVRDKITLLNNKERLSSKVEFMKHLIFVKKDYNYVKYIIANYPELSNIMLGNGCNLLEVAVGKYIDELLEKKVTNEMTDASYYERIIKLLVYYNSGLIRGVKISYIINSKTKNLELKEKEEISNHISNILICKGNLYNSNVILSNGLREKLAEFPIDKHGRYDLTSLYSVTIDNDNTVFIDDSLSGTVLSNGNMLLGIHIADVISNMTGNYFNISKIKELGATNFALSQSLKIDSSIFPLIPKNTVTHFFEIDSFGNIVDFKVVKSLIISSLRLCGNTSYESLMHQGDEKTKYNFLLYKEIFERMKCRFTTDSENVFYLGTLIGAFMPITNATVGDYFSKNNLPFMYRIKEQVDMGRILKLSNVYNFDEKKFASNLEQLEKQWSSCSKCYQYALFSRAVDYKEEYGRVTSPIIETMSRKLQALEHTYLINGDFSDSTYYMWERYLNSTQNTDDVKVITSKRRR